MLIGEIAKITNLRKAHFAIMRKRDYCRSKEIRMAFANMKKAGLDS